MSDLTLADVTQADVDAARATLINLILSDPSYYNLDMRVGTVLREILLNPSAEIWALESKQYEILRTTRSLQAMVDSGKPVTSEQIADVLSVFGVTLKAPTRATGTVMVMLTAGSDCTVNNGATFTTASGLGFTATATYSYSRVPTGSQLPILVSAAGGYYLLVPVTAVGDGDTYLVTVGTPFTLGSPPLGFTGATAYADFSGVTTVADVSQVIQGLPAAISYRALESRISIASILADPNFGNFNIRAISVIGAGDACMLRDKHNRFGGSMYGRVDIYPRTFEGLPIRLVVKAGVRTGPSTYVIELTQDETAGYDRVRQVTDADKTGVASYAFTDAQSPISVQTIPHDIAVDNASVESAFTKYRVSAIMVTGVQDNALQHMFNVELLSAPDVAAIQEYVDGTDKRNVCTDYLVRAPLICAVQVRATCDIPRNSAVTADQLASAVSTYINGLSFVEKLTQAEVIGVLMAQGVRYVDMTSDPTTGFSMTGIVRDASMTFHTLPGPDLAVGTVANPKVLLHQSTCIFSTMPSDMHIQVRAI